MIQASSHIVNKMTIDVQVNSLELANEIKENSNEWVRDVLSNALLNYFSKLEDKLDGQVIQLETLDLEIDVESLQDNPKILVDEFVRKMDDSFSSILSEVLVQKIGSKTHVNNHLDFNLTKVNSEGNSPRVQNSDQRTIQSLIYFLDTGQLPWWIKSNEELTLMLEERNLSALIQEKPSEVTKELKMWTKKSSFLRRLISQFSNVFVWELVSVLVSELSGKKVSNSVIAKSLFNELIEIEPSRKVQIVSLLINTIYLRNEVALSNFESELFIQLSRNSQALFTSSENVTKTFEVVTLISTLSDGSVVNYSSKADVQKEIAIKVSHTLDHVQLKSITKRENTSSLDSEVLVVFENRLLEKVKQLTKEIERQDEVSAPKVDLATNSKVANELISENEIQKNSKTDNETGNKEQLETRKTDAQGENGSKEKSTLESSDSLKDDVLNVEKKDDQAASDHSVIDASQDEGKNTEKQDDQFDSNKSSELVNQLENKNSEVSVQDLGKDPIKDSGQIIDKSNNQDQKEQGSSSNKTDVNHLDQEEQEISGLINNLNDETETSFKKDVKKVYEKSFLAENGGLVLLNPFLGSFFKSLELVNEKNIITNVDRAVYLLHYLATGNEQVFEHHLTFEKYLCDVPLNTIISKETVLTDDEKEQADNVLRSACEHWVKMKSSSIDLLRNEFLVRKCKVDRTGDSDRIKVERKSFDLLLDSLPWSVNIIKLPWKKELIFVEW